MKKENLQRISENQSALGVIGGGTITSESGDFRFNLGSWNDGISHEIRSMKSVTSEFGEYGLEEAAKKLVSSAYELKKEYILFKILGEQRFICSLRVPVSFLLRLIKINKEKPFMPYTLLGMIA